MGIVGTEGTSMIAIANTIRELMEIRKFACNLEEVLYVSYQDNKFPGKYITARERTDNKLSGSDEL